MTVLRMLKKIIILLAILAGLRYFLSPGEVALGPGVKAAGTPRQSAIEAPRSFDHNGFQVTPLADFSIRAKVLSREDYHFGREAELSPVDLALGWDRMSDEQVLQDIDISQSGRWYRWRTETFPIPRRDIETQSANMHLIPGDSLVQDRLDDVRAGQIVQLEGYLVRADADDGWHWVSSLTRDDTGGRSCELVYVKRVRIVRG